jgi:hypothetical protein
MFLKSLNLLIILIAIYGHFNNINGIKLTVENSIVASRPENVGIGMVK